MIPDNHTISLVINGNDVCDNLVWEEVQIQSSSGGGFPPTPSSLPGDLGSLEWLAWNYIYRTSLSDYYNTAFSIDYYAKASRNSSSGSNFAFVSSDTDIGFRPFVFNGTSASNISVNSYISSETISWDIINGDNVGQVTENDIHHYYIGLDGVDTIYLAIDGTIVGTYTYSGSIDSLRTNYFLIGNNKDSSMEYGYTQNSADISYMRISDICRWTDDFEPLTTVAEYEGTKKDSMIIVHDNKIYVPSNGQPQLVRNSLDRGSKDFLIQKYGVEIPCQFTMNNWFSEDTDQDIQILVCKQDSAPTVSISTSTTTITTTNISPNLVTPVDLITLTDCKHVDNVTITGQGDVGVAVTKDLTTWYTYNNGSFSTVNLAVDANLNTISQINAITESEWNTFTNNVNTIAFAYVLRNAGKVNELTIKYDKNDIEEIRDYAYVVTMYEYKDGELVNTIRYEEES